MNNNTKKGLNIALDVLLVILIAAMLMISINAVSSRDKGYSTIMGKTVYAAKTNSMDGKYENSFGQNALVFGIELTKEVEQKSIKVGEIITFWTVINGEVALNTHRVIQIIDEGGVNQQYITKGDNAPAADPEWVMWSDVVAKYDSKMEGVGAIVLFAQQPNGFFVLVVLPSILILVYCIFAFVTAFRRMKGDKVLVAKEEELKKQLEAEKEAEKERWMREAEEKIRAELAAKDAEKPEA